MSICSLIANSIYFSRGSKFDIFAYGEFDMLPTATFLVPKRGYIERDQRYTTESYRLLVCSIIRIDNKIVAVTRVTATIIIFCFFEKDMILSNLYVSFFSGGYRSDKSTSY